MEDSYYKSAKNRGMYDRVSVLTIVDAIFFASLILPADFRACTSAAGDASSVPISHVASIFFRH